VPDRHHPHRLTQKKLKTVADFQTQNSAVNTPRFTSNPPQLHHKNTTTKHHFSPKPPAKRPSTTKNKKSLKRAKNRRPGKSPDRIN
jgi:hypothetical protein